MTQGDVFIRYVPFPYTVKGVTLPNDDGTFSIYINSDLPRAQQEKALRHELAHIREGHFYDEAPLNEEEAAADQDETPIPEDVLIFARGGGAVTGHRYQRLLTLLDNTIDDVLGHLPASP